MKGFTSFLYNQYKLYIVMLKSFRKELYEMNLLSLEWVGFEPTSYTTVY